MQMKAQEIFQLWINNKCHFYKGELIIPEGLDDLTQDQKELIKAMQKAYWEGWTAGAKDQYQIDHEDD